MTHSDYINAVGRANYYSHMYYVASAPVVSDAEFDALVSQIEQYERINPSHILPDSPTQQVAAILRDCLQAAADYWAATHPAQ